MAQCHVGFQHLHGTVPKHRAAARSLTSRQPDSFQYWTLVFNYNARCGDSSPATPVHAVQVRPPCATRTPYSNLRMVHMRVYIFQMGARTVPLTCQLPCGVRCDSADRAPAQGVRLVFYNDESDILLLQQMSEIPRDFKPYFMGESVALACKDWYLMACAVMREVLCMQWECIGVLPWFPWHMWPLAQGTRLPHADAS